MMEQRKESHEPSVEDTFSHDPSRSAPLKTQLSPVLDLFRDAVLRDHRLQEQLRNADTCEEVADIANAFFRYNFRLETSDDIRKTPLRGQAEDTFRDMFHVTVEDLEQHILYQVNNQGEILLGASELEMVAGSTRLAAGSCYSCSCGNTCQAAKSC